MFLSLKCLACDGVPPTIFETNLDTLDVSPCGWFGLDFLCMLSTAPVFIAAGLSHLLTDHRQSGLALMFATTPVQRWRHCSPADDFSDFHQDCQSKMNPLTLYLGPWALGALGRWAGLEASHGRQFSKRVRFFSPLKAATENFFDKEH